MPAAYNFAQASGGLRAHTRALRHAIQAVVRREKALAGLAFCARPALGRPRAGSPPLPKLAGT